jgi:hypothetical protein
MTKTTSFQADIRPLFTERDIQGMSKAINLESYDDVKKHAGAIYDRIRGIGGAVMPPPPPKGEGLWQLSRIELIRQVDGRRVPTLASLKRPRLVLSYTRELHSLFGWRVS